MKQPAKFSIAVLVLAVLAAIFYPNLQKGAEGDAGSSTTAATSSQASPTSPEGTQQTQPAAPSSPVVDGSVGDSAAELPPDDATQALAQGASARAPPKGDATKNPSTPPPGAQAQKPAPTQQKPAAQKPAPHTPAKPTPSKVGFTSRQSWLDHFAKHGSEFGKITADEYLARAQALRDAPLTSTVIEGVRESDGVITRFDKKSGGFVAFHKDKSIRTFFRPNDGEAYFKRQLQR